MLAEIVLILYGMDEVEDKVEVKNIEDRARDLCLEAERVPDQL